MPEKNGARSTVTVRIGRALAVKRGHVAAITPTSVGLVVGLWPQLRGNRPDEMVEARIDDVPRGAAFHVPGAYD